MRVNRVGVVGAGVIGTSTAQDLAQTGHEVLMIDVDERILERARKEIATGVRFHHLIARTSERQKVSEVLGRIHLSTDYDVLASAEFIIENTTENWEIKKVVYQRLDNICREDIVFAANTSAITITRIASVTRRAPQVVGLHFMNPVPLSCRVMSRGVGKVLLSYVIQTAAAAGKRVQAEFVRTERNRLMYLTFKFAGFREIERNGKVVVLEHGLDPIEPFPKHVQVVVPS